MNPGPQSSNRVSLVEVVEKLRDLAQANIDSGEHSDSSVFVGHVQMANAILDAIPNRAHAIPGAATGANPLTHATPNRAQAQTSLTEQIESVLELATNRGYYDAADWISQVWRQWGKRG